PRPTEVEPFVSKMGNRMDYSIALDDCPPAPAHIKNPSKWAVDHGKMSVGWMKASGWDEEGIPTAFIVDGDGKIAWIGDPEGLDKPLSKIVAGDWGLPAEAAHYREHTELRIKSRMVQKRLNDRLKKKDWQAAVQICDEMLALDPVGSAHIAGCKFQTLLTEIKDTDKAYAFGHMAVERIAR